MKRLLRTLCLTLALWVAVAVLPVAAQELPTVTTYYRPPTVATTVSYSGTVGYTPSVAYYAAPTVSYYAAPVVAYSAPVVAYSAPSVAYYAPSAPVVASTSYYYRPGLFRPRVYGSTTYYTPSASYYAPAYSSYYAPAYSSYYAPYSSYYAPAYSSYYYSPRYFRY